MDPEVSESGNLDQERKLECTCDSDSVNPCVQILSSHRDQGITQESTGSTGIKEEICLSVETPMVSATDGLNMRDIHSGECLAEEPLLNEHFNNLHPDESEHTVSRTERTGGGISRTPGHLNQEPTDSAVDECPICTEPYHTQGDHSVALLNCDHTVCQRCLAVMLKRAADCSRVQCPLCRQKTPLLQWQIYRLQEDVAFCTSHPADLSILTPQPEPEVSTGFCSSLEQCLQVRAETARVCGCFEHPRGLIQAIRRIQRRCRCCYVTLLVILYMVELSFLMLVFLPVLVLVLLFTLAT
ncbi:E3 ubiquitin-protein ligase RNF186-like [Pangasianodon hypophthalmus]|uniref:E3 ubiquitin-protein ligase RNF186-like n=1 Tax=Pangasianodon hypophthalmus TaxID=310915 RepID=UPI0023072F78|nr:E3 ubiquitin-protein ligase RNF186-like [Pangasianodon hypophthalmus]